MYYDRKIWYLDYRENGERIRGVGFLKLEIRDKLCFLTMQVNNLGDLNNYCRPIFLLSEEREVQLCELQLQRGKGSVQLQVSCDNLCGGIPCDKWNALYIPITAGKEIYCVIQGSKCASTEGLKSVAEDLSKVRFCTEADKKNIVGDVIKGSDTAEEKTLKVVSMEEAAPQEISLKESLSEKSLSEESLSEENPSEESLSEESLSEKRTTKESPSEERALEGSPLEEISSKEILLAEQTSTKIEIQENKWMQLSAIYKHINPFRDEREYLSIGPGDFVILSEKYYKLVNNSFLLHGYYNYKHLILTKLKYRGKEGYYLGVPGNFYEREKQVAMMFGFESFECREEPAQPGDYGYYMIRVEL